MYSIGCQFASTAIWTTGWSPIQRRSSSVKIGFQQAVAAPVPTEPVSSIVANTWRSMRHTGRCAENLASMIDSLGIEATGTRFTGAERARDWWTTA
ncbi:Uncharacterised protein [Burkholderia cenocepacia]|nr:Uncharacterised protein [Burkholderia cenocepacia]